MVSLSGVHRSAGVGLVPPRRRDLFAADDVELPDRRIAGFLLSLSISAVTLRGKGMDKSWA